LSAGVRSRQAIYQADRVLIWTRSAFSHFDTEIEMTEKHCSYGNHNADIANFGKNARTPDGLQISCRACVNLREKKRQGKYRLGRLPEVNRTRFQVASFQAFFNAAKLGGKTNREAFISAVCYSCDEAVDALPDGSIAKWLKRLDDRKVAALV
jgi:hypothetical protein